MMCPYCGFDNEANNTNFCDSCGAVLGPNIKDITLLFPKIKQYIDRGEISFYVKIGYNYGQDEFNLLRNFLPDNYKLEIVKRLRQSDDVFIEMIRDRRKPKFEKEMYHIYQKNMYDTDSEVEYLLQKSGKEVFLNILYPELIRDKNVTIEEISNKYPRYASFSIDSQRTRLRKAKKIFELNKQKEAMHIILLSNKLSQRDRYIARQYYKDL